MFSRFIVLTLTLLSLGAPALAATLSVPLEYPTIQAAVDAALPGDEVLIANGSYREPVVLKADVSLRGESRDGTILYNPGPQYIFSARDVYGASVANLTLENDLDTWTLGAWMLNAPVDFDNVTIRGFSSALFYRGNIYSRTSLGLVDPITPSITNSLFENNGTAINLRDGVDGTVTDNVFSNNSGSAVMNDGFCYSTIQNNSITGNGHGVYATSESLPLIENNIITGNGNGISTAWRSHAVVRQNIISGNSLNGISSYSFSRPTIQNNLISGNGNEGIWAFLTFSHIVNNTIVANGANGVRAEWYASPSLRNNIIAFNGSLGVNDSADHAFYHSGYRARANLFYNTLFGNAAGEIAPNIYLYDGNIFADPLFRDVTADNYQLSAASPAIDTGDPNVIYNDLDGSRNNMGAYGGPYTLPGSEPTPEEIIEEAQSKITVLPDIAFKNEADGRKEELELKLDEILSLIELGDAETDPLLQEELYRDALNKLKNDLLKKADGYFGGKPNNDWIVSYEAQSVLNPLLVDLINEVEALLVL